jgi:protein-S-isoprenylcysteine O-methyltransferase Ste14
MQILYLGVVVVVLLAVWCLRAVRQEYRTRQRLLLPTVAAVWIFYTLQGVLTAFAAWESVWQLPLSPASSQPVGAGALMVGLGIAVAAVVEFRSLRRMSGTLSNKLVTSGIYRWSRNPQNVGWGVACLGAALLGRSGLALLLTGLFWAMLLIYLPAEEDYLERAFGEEYRRYRLTTARLWGRPK